MRNKGGRLVKIKLFLALASGLLTGLAFFNSAFWALAWVSLMPFFYVIFTAKKHGFFISFLFGLTYYLSLTSWILALHPLTWMGLTLNVSLILCISAWITVGFIGAFPIAILGWLFIKAGKKSPLILACGWMIMEFCQGYSGGALGFTWGRLANSQYIHPAIIQSASIFGSLFISGIIVYFSASVINSIVKREHSHLCISLVIVALNFTYGFTTLKLWHAGETTTVSAVQGNLPSMTKWSTDIDRTLDIYLNLASSAKGDIIIFPETAIPVYLPENKLSYDRLQSFGKTLFVGAFESDGENDYSSIFVIDGAKEINTYRKRHLVPLGEYIPLKNVFNRFLPLLAETIDINDLKPGDKARVLNVNGKKIGAIICFDSIFSRFTSDAVKEGAQLLVVSTNDSWFDNTAALSQHLSQSVMRAVETGRYVVRAANTGITASINPKGIITKTIMPSKEGVLDADVEFLLGKTFYVSTGEIILIPAFLFIIFSIWRKRNEKV